MILYSLSSCLSPLQSINIGYVWFTIFYPTPRSFLILTNNRSLALNIFVTYMCWTLWLIYLVHIRLNRCPHILFLFIYWLQQRIWIYWFARLCLSEWCFLLISSFVFRIVKRYHWLFSGSLFSLKFFKVICLDLITFKWSIWIKDEISIKIDKNLLHLSKNLESWIYS